MNNSRRSKSVLITGCSSGFGRQMVTAFLENGWTVFATLRRADERRPDFSEEQTCFGARLIILECDVTSNRDRQSIREAVERAGLDLDCLINNAGYMLLGALEDTGEEQLRVQMETNFFGAVLLIQQFLPFLRKSRGTIINVSSVFGFTTWPLTSVYCASKYALEGLTQSLSQELEPHGVRAVLLEPGSYPTALMDNLRWSNRIGDNESAYRLETNAYRMFRKGLAERKVKNTSEVAQAAVCVAENSQPHLRRPIGISTRLIYIAVRLCPEMVGVKLMAWIARRAFRKSVTSSSNTESLDQT